MLHQENQSQKKRSSVASVARVAKFPASSNVGALTLGCNADNGASSSIALTSSCKFWRKTHRNPRLPPPNANPSQEIRPCEGILHHCPLIWFYKGLFPWDREDTRRFPLENLRGPVAPRRTFRLPRSSRFPLDKGVGKIAQQNPVLDALIQWMKHEFICLRCVVWTKTLLKASFFSITNRQPEEWWFIC